jgi:hypothetical protein
MVMGRKALNLVETILIMLAQMRQMAIILLKSMLKIWALCIKM